MKPREWTLEWDRDNQRWRFVSWQSGNDSDYDGIHPKFIQVIEKSAYDELAKALTKAAYLIDQDHHEQCADQDEIFGPNETCECRAIERRALIEEIHRLLHVEGDNL